MKKLLILLILFISSATADAKRLAVTDFTSVKANKQVLNLMTEMVRNEAANQLTASGIAVIDKQNMVSLLKDQGKDVECIGGECEIEIGRNLGADYVITGNLILDEGDWILSLSLYNTASGAKIKGKTITKSSKRGLRKAIPEVTKLLVLGLNKRNSIQNGTFNEGFGAQEDDDWKPQGETLVTVSFQSSPTGATVLMDGDVLCETPCSQDVPEGPHQFRFTKQRYSGENRDLTAKDGTRIRVQLQPKFGWFSVDSNPSGIDLYSNGDLIGKTPISRREIKPGIHKLEVKDTCYKPLRYRFQAKANEHKSNIPTFKLKARQSAIQVTAKKGKDALSAAVYVDGKKVGKTGKVIKVPLCSKEIALHTKRGKIWSKAVLLKEKQVRKIKANFDNEEQNSPMGRQFHDALKKSRPFYAAKIDGPSQKNPSMTKTKKVLAQQFTRKTQLQKELQSRFRKIVSSKNPWSIKAIYEIAKSYDHWADSIENSYVPEFENKEQKEIYAMAMQDRAFPIRQKAIDYYEKTITESEKISLQTPRIVDAYERLSILKPSQYSLPGADLWPVDGVWPTSGKMVDSTIQEGFTALRHGQLKPAVAAFKQSGWNNTDARIGQAIGLLMTFYVQKGLDSLASLSNHPDACLLHATLEKNPKQARTIIKECRQRHARAYPGYQAAVVSVEATIQQMIEKEAQKKQAIIKQKTRKKRLEAQFKATKKHFKTVQAAYERLKSCKGASEELEMVSGYLEGVEELLAENDIEMAGDGMAFIDEAQRMLEEIAKHCNR